MTSIILSGCGSTSGSTDTSQSYFGGSAYDNGVYESAIETEESADYDYSYESKAYGDDSVEIDDNAGNVETGRKLITTIDISAETDNLDNAIALVEEKTTSLGGYIEASNIYNGSMYNGLGYRSASLTIRIPAEKADLFVDSVEGETNIVNKSVNVDDVTLSYVDIESRKNALKAEEKRLLEIIGSAETVEDLIAVEERLADVRYELESIESQLRTYDNRINYTTVYLRLDEVVEFTEVEKEGALARMGKGFVRSIHSVLDGFVEAAVWFVIHIPQIIIFVIIVLIIVFIIRRLVKKTRQMPYYVQGAEKPQEDKHE